MILVTVRNLWFYKHIWVGLVVTIFTSAFLVQTGLNINYAVDKYAETTGDMSFKDTFIPVIGIIILTAVVSLNTVSLQVVAQIRRSLAVLILSGFGPLKISFTILTQFIFLSVTVSVFGALASIPFFPAINSFFTWAMFETEDIKALGDLSNVLSTVIILTITIAVSSIPSMIKTIRINPLEAIKERESTGSRVGILRILFFIISIIITSSIIFNLLNIEKLSSLTTGASNSANENSTIQLITVSGVGLLFSITIVFLCAGPLYYKVLTRFWSSIIPRMIALPWFLARKSATYRTAQSSTIISSVMLPVSFISGLFTVFLTSTQALPGDNSINYSAIFTIVSGPAILSFITAAVSIFMTNRERHKDTSLTSVIGIKPSQNIQASIFEAIIYSVTSLIPVIVINLIIGFFLSQAFTSHFGKNIPAIYGFYQGLLFVMIALIITMLSTLVPTVQSLRKSPIDSLSKAT